MAAERSMQHDSERPDQSLVIPYGLGYAHAQVLPSSPENPFLRIAVPVAEGESVTIATNLVGSYNADNVMAAIAVGRHFGVTLEEAVAAIEAYIPSNNRSQMTKTDRNTLIVDAYNANPTSMEAALTNFSNVEAPIKVALLGDMLELGDESQAEHVKIAKMALSLGLERVCFVGAEFEKAVEQMEGRGETFCSFGTSADLALWLKENPLDSAVVLIKGSRGTRMEKVVEVL
jgi:UDP-N-acetylmuramoyl-tripeptide--D-alanyl-D-alanine ligase